jgi:hypothetical protein
MVKMGMRYEYVINERKLYQGEVADPGSAIDEDIVVDQHGRSTQVPATNATTAT